MGSKLAVLLIIVVLATGLLAAVDYFGDSGERTEMEGGNGTGEKNFTDTELYLNEYQYLSSPEWVPENRFSKENLSHHTYEVTRYPHTEPTTEDIESAWELYNESYDAAKERGWFDFENATQDGFVEGAERHYLKIEYLFDNRSLDPHRPESLIYYEDPQEEENKILVGYMYHKVPGTKTEGEQVGGPLTVWHYHPTDSFSIEKHLESYVSNREEFDTPDEVFESVGLDYEDSKDFIKENRRSAEMLHVWFVRHPEGPFGTAMTTPKGAELAKPEKMSEEGFKTYAVEKHRKFSTDG